MRLIQELRPWTQVCVVGEAPGAREDELGKPFAGKTGELLFDELGPRAGLHREQCSITNVVHVRPPGNDFSRFIRPKPSPEYILGLLQLKSDLEVLRPNVVIALGAQALRVLTKRTSIDKWHGSILPCTLVPDLKVVGTWHPAYTFKDAYDYRYVIERDLRRAMEESATPRLRLPERQLIIDPPADERDQLTAEMLRSSWLAIDIEAYDSPTKPLGWAIYCVGFSDGAERALVLPWRPDTVPTIAMLCESQQPKIFQNGWAFDLPVLLDHGIAVSGYAWDTMAGFHALYPECAASDEETAAITGKKRPRQPALRKGLAFQTAWYTREPFYKDDGKTWSLKGDTQILYRYNARDACVTREVAGRQFEDLAEMGTFHVLKHAMGLMPSCMTMSQLGFKVDLAERERLRAKYQSEIDNLQSLLDTIAGRSINVKSPDVKWLLFEHLKLPIRKRSDKTGVPSADKYAIADLALKHPHPALMTVLEIRERRDVLERYLSVPIGEDGRWRCTWDVTGTRTWRLASRAYIDRTGGNLQNQPESLRSMFVPDEGMVLISVDLSQAEARVVAWEAECLGLIELFSDPARDVHTENAARFYAIPTSEVSYQQRYAAKRTVHASNYGMGPERFVEVVNADARETGIRITLEDAALSQQKYFMLYPEIKNNYWQECRDSIRRNRIITNVYGFKRLFLGQWSEKFLHEVYAQKPQSTIGILTCRSQVRVYEELQLHGEAELLVNGHDSLVVQVPEENAAAVAQRIQELMTERLIIKGRPLVIPTEVSVGRNWGKRTESNPNGLRPLHAWLGGSGGETK